MREILDYEDTQQSVKEIEIEPYFEHKYLIMRQRKKLLYKSETSWLTQEQVWIVKAVETVIE